MCFISNPYILYHRIGAIWVFPYKLNPCKLDYASRQLGNWCLRAKTQYLASSVESKACWDLLAFQISINSLWATNNASLQVPSPGMQKTWLRIIFALIYHTASLSCIYMYYSHKQILNMFPVYLRIIGTIVICSYMSLGFISFLIFVATQNMAYNLQKAGVTINMAQKGWNPDWAFTCDKIIPR